MTPVAEPSNLVSFARIGNVQATFDAAMRIANQPSITLAGLLRKAGAGDRSALFKLDSSVDLAVAIDPTSSHEDPKFLAAVSIPLRNLEETRAAMASNFVPIAPGIYRGVLVELDTERGKPTHCDLGPSLGNAPARMVCADSDRELDALRAWLTRGLTLQSPGLSDLHAEIRARPFQQMYQSEMERGVDEAAQQSREWLEKELNVRDPELLSAPGIVLRHGKTFVDEIDTVVFDSALDPNQTQVALRGSVTFRSANSWFTKVLTHRNDRQGVPPAIFWRAPKESESVVYSRGADKSLYTGIDRVVRLAASTLLARAGVKPKTRTAVEDFLSWSPEPDVVTVSAAGSSVRPAKKPRAGGTAKKRPADAIEEFRGYVDSYMGWWLTGVDAPADPYIAWMRKGATAVSLLIEEVRAQLPNKADQTWLPSVKVVAAPQGYPKGSVAFDMPFTYDSKLAWSILPGFSDEEHPAGPGIKATIALRMIIVPDGPRRTWIGIAVDPNLLRSRIAAALEGASDSGTIANLPGLGPLKSGVATSAGFVTYGNTLQKTFGLSELDKEGDLKEFVAAFSAAPNRWMTPMLLMTRGTAGPSPANSVEILVQKGTIEDVIALVQYALAHDLAKDKGSGVLTGPIGRKPPVAPPPPPPPPPPPRRRP